jgi:hypothetical protein
MPAGRTSQCTCNVLSVAAFSNQWRASSAARSRLYCLEGGSTAVRGMQHSSKDSP